MMHESSPLRFPEGFLSINRLVYDQLRQGVHFAPTMDEFRRMQNFRQEFESFYDAIGLVIRFTPHAIFLESRETQRLSSERIQQVSMFYIILAPHYEETEGRNLREAVRLESTMKITDLPHSTQASARLMMRKVGVESDTELTKLLKFMASKGFIRTIGDEIQLLGPSMRFIHAIQNHSIDHKDTISEEE